MVSLGSYLLGAAELALVALSLGFSAYRLRAAPDARLGRRPGPPGRGDRRRRPADLDLRDPRHLRAASTPGLSSAPRSWSLSPWRSLPGGGGGAGVPRGAEGRSAEHRGGCRTDRTRRPGRLAAADHGRGHRSRGRALGIDDEARAGPRDLQLRLALVPPAVRGGHGAEPLRDRDASRRHGVHELVLSAELGVAPRRRDAADGAGHAVAVPQLRVAGGGFPGCLVHRQAVRAGGPQRRRGGDPARGARAGRARAGGGQERPDGGGADPGRDRDPRQRLDTRSAAGRDASGKPRREVRRCRSAGRWRRPGSRWGWPPGQR